MIVFHDYALKVCLHDVDALREMAVRMRLLTLDGETQRLLPAAGVSWDEIGPIYRPTGVVLTDEDGAEYPELAPIVDEHGVPYVHINVRLRKSLRAIAEVAAVHDAQIAAALQELGRYFVVDEEGNARQPNSPARVWG